MPTQLTRAALDDTATTLQSAVAATGNGNALAVSGYGTVAAQVTGTFSATITWEITLDGTNWVSAQGFKTADAVVATTATTTGIYLVNTVGAKQFRARVTWTSGTSVTVVALGVPDSAAAVTATGGTTSTVTATQGTAGSSPWLVTLRPGTTGGTSIYRNIDTGTTGVRIKSGAGQVYGWFLSNANATTAMYVKLYDTNTDPPTSAMTPVMTVRIPAASSANVAFPNGIAFASGIGIRASAALADNDATAPTAGDVVTNLFYA